MSLPKILVAPEPMEKVNRPDFFKPATIEKKSEPIVEETLFSWVKSMIVSVRKVIPGALKKLMIPLAVIAVVNIVLWPLQTWKLPSSISNVVMFFIFITATYNNFIPKTIFWVIVFTFGKRLFHRFRKQGIKAFDPLKQVVPQLLSSYHQLKQRANTYLLLGIGFGLMIANYFASYSRFPGARNKFDKYFVALLVAFTVTYLLGESDRGGIFKFVRLLINDISRFLKKPYRFTEQMSHLLFGGLIAGLLLDAILILLKFMYGGYILGAISIIAAITLLFTVKKPEKA